MLFGGIDIGSLTAQAVIIEEPDGKSARLKIHTKSIRVKPDPVESAKEVMGALLKDIGINWEYMKYVVSTGYGRERVQQEGLSHDNISEISCHGAGAFALYPNVRTVIDIGGQDAKVIRVGPGGELENFVMNDKCAAGTGRFLEVMSKTIGTDYEKLGFLALKSRNRFELSSRCSIFAENEVLHYLQRGASVEDLAAGISRSMADRVMALARRVGVEREVMMTGGVAKNVAVKAELEKKLGLRIVSPSLDPQLIGAYGAAVLARRSWRES